MTHPFLVSSQAFGNALVQAGVLTRDQLNVTRRIVIDAQAGHMVSVYVELAGDERLLSAVLGPDGIKVTGTEQPPLAVRPLGRDELEGDDLG